MERGTEGRDGLDWNGEEGSFGDREVDAQYMLGQQRELRTELRNRSFIMGHRNTINGTAAISSRNWLFASFSGSGFAPPAAFGAMLRDVREVERRIPVKTRMTWPFL